MRQSFSLGSSWERATQTRIHEPPVLVLHQECGIGASDSCASSPLPVSPGTSTTGGRSLRTARARPVHPAVAKAPRRRKDAIAALRLQRGAHEGDGQGCADAGFEAKWFELKP
mmetsp:Transcript_39388/g.117912  ORF Transcript_39388/g.117912 Transcript_39388/m.117912 type:complete len:113 (+) Transcript_39388:1080-1418(+)